MNSFKINTTKLVFFIFGCWLLPEKFSDCPKSITCPTQRAAGSYGYDSRDAMTAGML